MDSVALKEKCRHWISQEAVPLLLRSGVDHQLGGFYEALDMAGNSLDLPRRAMVHARQIYFFTVATSLGFCPMDKGKEVVRAGVKKALGYSLPSGAFFHSATADGKPVQEQSELYSQAFLLFGLAHAYSLLGGEELVERAKKLLHYLRKNRAAPGGGFTEILGGKNCFRSNPHMHLFEASIAWMKLSKDPAWAELAEELSQLCLQKFIDPATGYLAEYFSQGWEIEKSQNGFVVEPGHHYEWCWLLGEYEKLSGKKISIARENLYQKAEHKGICPKRGVVFDEIWSDGSVKKSSSRYWPQCERIKAALSLPSSKDHQAADLSMELLLRYLKTPTPGLCFNQMLEDGSFSKEPPMASCYYHIINAQEEYLRLR